MTQNTTNNMMDNYFNSDPTNFDETPFHLITTDHPYMATLGLSTFSTGTLYRWWNKKDGEGKHVNHRHFSSVAGMPSPHDLLLGTDTASNTDKSSDIGKGQFAFQPWRKSGWIVGGSLSTDAGKYVQSYADGGHTSQWTFAQAGNNEAGRPRAYNYAQVDLGKYDNKFFNPDMSLGIEFEHPDGQGGQEMVSFIGIEPITNIIVLNDYVNKLELDTVDKSTWSQEQFAQTEFILDIQSSKEGYVEWSGYVPFKINLHDGDDTKFECDKPEWVKYRLYLHPNSAPRSTRRGIAMAKPTFAGPPVDSLGRKYQFKEDGRFSAFPEGSKAAEVVAELDMTFNEYTGKWEAGSKQMIGVVTQQIEPAQTVSSARLRNLQPEEMLRNPNDPNSHIIWGSGGAFPLNMQNGNPMQWTPNYAQSSEVDEDGKFSILCPEESDEKASLRVFNASAKAHEVDQYVLLNQIDGLWFAIDFPSGIPGPTGVIAGFDGLWDFSYFATNVVHYFKTDMNTRVNPSDVEKGLHEAYYAHDFYQHPIGGPAGWSRATPIPGAPVMNGAINEALLEGGYHQFSSFDMMDQQIGGTRITAVGNTAAANAYGITNPVEGPNGETVESDHNGYATGPFFGCLFPDGYDSQDIAMFRADRTFVGKPTIADSGLVATPLGPKWQSTVTSWKSLRGGTGFVYFHKTGIEKDGRPFNDGLARQDYKNGFVDPATGGLIPMFNDSDTSLSQLPADIALNAAPFNPENGQPLTCLHMISEIYNNATGIIAGAEGWVFKEKVKELFTKGKNWLYRKHDDDDTSVGIKPFTESSCFDFKPVRPNRIMFRPLKVEAYSQFCEPQYDAAIAATNDRQHFSQMAAETMTSHFRPASKRSYDREFSRDADMTALNPGGGFGVWPPVGIAAPPTPFTENAFGGPGMPPVAPTHGMGMDGTIYHLYNSRWGLQLNIDIPATFNAGEPGWINRLNFHTNPLASLPHSRRFHQNAWGFVDNRNSWMHGQAADMGDAFLGIVGSNQGSNPSWRHYRTASAGAVGVIGAIATCTANSKIRFESVCKLGIRSYNFPVTVAAGITQQPSWGTGNGYRDFETTNLFVKVYHAWPREQTIYDPRYYAVHHFNPGIGDKTETLDPESFVTDTERRVTSTPQRDPTNLGNVEYFPYDVDDWKYAFLDAQEPSSLQKHPFVLADPYDETVAANIPLAALLGSRFYATRVNHSDGSFPGVVDSSKICETIQAWAWNIWHLPGFTRRAKLLPFKWLQRQVMIPKIRVELPFFDIAASSGVSPDPAMRDIAEIYRTGGYAVLRDGPQNVNPLDADYGFYPTKIVPFFDKTKPVGSQYRTFDPMANPDTEDVLAIVGNPGIKYALGDTFLTNQQGNLTADIRDEPHPYGDKAMIKAIKPSFRPGTNPGLAGDSFSINGAIEAFEVVLQGYNFGHEGFAIVEEAYSFVDSAGNAQTRDAVPVTNFSMGHMFLDGGDPAYFGQPTVNGTGFDFRVIRGEVDYIFGTDKKPEIATSADLNRISIKSETRGTSAAGDPHYTPLTDTYDIELDITNPNDTSRVVRGWQRNEDYSRLANKYDLFFHFHNDISMTFMTNQNKVGAHGPAINDEQYIDLTITTT
jgi:hypothetical protein